ncbi:MAG: FtsK/SpoIIIE domain-containing protein [Bacilli bacterium]
MYRRLGGYSLPSFTYYLFRLPKLLVCLVWYIVIYHDKKLIKEHVEELWEDWRIVNEIRKTCFYYVEKDIQDRGTLICTYKKNNQCIFVKVKFEKKATETTYEQFKETVAQHTSYNCSEMKFKKGYGEFYIITNFAPLYDYKVNNECVSVGTGIEGLLLWNWTEYPHALIVGDTGSGKSVYVRYILNGLFKGGHDVWCIDGKVIDYSVCKTFFEHYEPNQANKEPILKLIRKFDWQMRKRYEDMAKLGITSYLDSDELKPVFLLIDEYLVLVEQFESKANSKTEISERKELENLIKNITLLGRACGYILILTMQRADAKYIGGAIRDNFLLRVALGDASSESYRMMFNQSVKGFDKGHAWCQLANKLDVIAIPFYKSIEKPMMKKEELKKINDDDE